MNTSNTNTISIIKQKINEQQLKCFLKKNLLNLSANYIAIQKQLKDLNYNTTTCLAQNTKIENYFIINKQIKKLKNKCKNLENENIITKELLTKKNEEKKKLRIKNCKK